MDQAATSEQKRLQRDVFRVRSMAGYVCLMRSTTTDNVHVYVYLKIAHDSMKEENLP